MTTTRTDTDATRPARAWLTTVVRRLDEYTRATFNPPAELRGRR
jgi:hypothetical protein